MHRMIRSLLLALGWASRAGLGLGQRRAGGRCIRRSWRRPASADETNAQRA